MSMNLSAHPDPERLAALAGDDADARADRGLTLHVAECTACTGQVRGMTALRLALAELPDVAPSRPLVLLPPAAAERATGGWIGLRRVFAPMAVSGMVLLLVGSVGVTGALGPADAASLFRLSAAAPEAAEGPETGNTDSGASPVGAPGVLGPTESERAIVSPPDEAGIGGEAGRDIDDGAPGTRTGWILIAAAGVGLLGGALVLRRRTGLT